MYYISGLSIKIGIQVISRLGCLREASAVIYTTLPQKEMAYESKDLYQPVYTLLNLYQTVGSC